MDDDEEGEDGINEMERDVDEETLIQQKSPYEQKVIREHRQLFSESLDLSRYLKCPPMKIKLKQSLSSKLAHPYTGSSREQSPCTLRSRPNSFWTTWRNKG